MVRFRLLYHQQKQQGDATFLPVVEAEATEAFSQPPHVALESASFPPIAKAIAKAVEEATHSIFIIQFARPPLPGRKQFQSSSPLKKIHHNGSIHCTIDVYYL